MAICKFNVMWGDCLSGLSGGRCTNGEAFDEEDIWSKLGETLTWERGTCAMAREDPIRDCVFTWIGWC